MAERVETLGTYAARQLTGLCEVAGFGGDTERAVGMFQRLTRSWGDRRRDRAPRWSGFSDDCTPYEMSVVLGAAMPEVRVGFETQSPAPSAPSYWEAALALNREIEAQFGVDFEPLRRVEDLFRPSDPDAYFAMWHGVCFWPGRAPAFKLYLNPYASGRARGLEVLDLALGRLGFPEAVGALTSCMRPGLDQVLGVGIDLSPDLGKRAKVYIRMRRATRDHVARLAGFAKDGHAEEAAAFASIMTGGDGPFERRPLQFCYAFTDPLERGVRADRATLLVPPITYAPNEAAIRDRVAGLLTRLGYSAAEYRRYAEAFFPGAAEDDRGAHGYVSLQWEAGKPRVTAYFYGRAFRERFGEVDPSSPWPSPHPAYREAG